MSGWRRTKWRILAWSGTKTGTRTKAKWAFATVLLKFLFLQRWNYDGNKSHKLPPTLCPLWLFVCVVTVCLCVEPLCWCEAVKSCLPTLVFKSSSMLLQKPSLKSNNEQTWTSLKGTYEGFFQLNYLGSTIQHKHSFYTQKEKKKLWLKCFKPFLQQQIIHHQ